MAGGIFARDNKGKHLDDETLSCYMDGALTPAEMVSVRRHLAACPDCAANLRSLQQTVLLLKELPQVACPRPFILREADVAPQRARPSGLFVFLRTATAAVAVLLAVVLAGDFLLRQTAPVPIGTPDLFMAREAEPAAGVQLKAPAAPTAAVERMIVAPNAAPTEAPAIPSPQPTPVAPVIATQVVELAPTPTAVPQRAATTSQPPAPPPTQPTAIPATRTATLSGPPPSPTSEGGQDKVADTQVIQPTSVLAFQPTAEPDETATASAAMMAAPAGKGAEEPTPIAQPAAEAAPSPTHTAPLPATPIPPTATLVPPTPTPVRPTSTPPAATGIARAEPQATVSLPDFRPVNAPAAAQWGPLFRIAEITLGLIVLALAALTILSRRT